MRRRILFLISSLNPGGAERQLVNLVSGLNPDRWDVCILCTHEKGSWGADVERAGVRVVALDRGARRLVPFLSSLVREIRRFNPDLIHAYLVSPQFYALLLHPFMRRIPLVLGIRSSFVDVGHYGFSTTLLYRGVERMSAWADAYLLNSHAGADFYASRGFDRRKMTVVSNGIRVADFEPNRERAVWARRALGWSADDRLVAVVAALEHMKGHSVFVDAAALASRACPRARFVLIGRDATPHGKAIKQLVASRGLTEKFSFVGQRDDVSDLLNGIDVLCSSSIGEGFSNVIAEAMSMRVPCVVTDVGDSARIVGDTGWVVPPGDARRMADAIVEALSEPPESLRERGRLARRRIAEQFTVAEMVRQTERVYQGLLGGPAWTPAES